MTAQVLSTVENNFTKGLLTEFTGLNFPENAATDTANCVYTLVGDVVRREGFDYEANGSTIKSSRNNLAVNSYKWNNVGGDGSTQIVVQQYGSLLFFFRSSTANTAKPLSSQQIGNVIDISLYLTAGVFDATQECQFTDGNGYLFVFHPQLNPLYITYNNGSLTTNTITIKIRDFIGIPEGIDPNVRPTALSSEHQYNLQNQGWTSGNAWSATSADLTGWSSGGVTINWTIGTVSGISNGQVVLIRGTVPGEPWYVNMSGTVTGYSGGVLSLNIFSGNSNGRPNDSFSTWSFTPTNTGYIGTWFTAEGKYPSNADVWWYFKDSSGVFNPAVTQPNITLSFGNAPRGHYVLEAFNQDKTNVSGITGLTTISTSIRPTNGCWFLGRVWYTGINASQPALGDANFYTWTENIYFSRIVNDVTDFGNCYQVNDPTSSNLFNLLPSDGGVITIQGSGNIYKLFPLYNALLVFAANGIWYISGSSGVGFTANDYTVVKLSAVKCMSGTSFVDVNGLPIFWNEEGIYQVSPAKQGTQLLNSPLHVQPLEVSPLTVGTILSYYNNIPLQSKKYARGAYSPIDYTVQWCFRSTNESTVTDRYTFDSILNYNVHNQAFFPYTFNTTGPTINGMVYVSSPGGSSAPNSIFKYLVSYNGVFTFGEERDTTYTDWFTSGKSSDFTSYFVTGFKVHGQGQKRFQIPYVDVFIRNEANTGSSYKIQSIWDYANTANSGRWSIAQLINNWNPNYTMSFRRHRLRGRGLVLQIKVTSVTGQPFDIMGWSSFETANTGV